MTKPVQFPAAQKPFGSARGKRFMHASALAPSDYITGPAEDTVSFTSWCDELWDVSPRERAELATALARLAAQG